MKKQQEDIIKKGLEIIKNHPRIFYNAYKVPSYNDEPAFFQYNILFKDKFIKGDSSAVATGTSFSQINALRKSFGEMIERYSLSAIDQNILRKRSYTAGSKMIKPLRFVSFSNKQLKKLNLTTELYQNSKYSWVKCKKLKTGENCYIPSQLVYVPYKYEAEEPTLQATSSSGAACGMSLEEALYRGVCELLERDSFLISYLYKLPSKRINIDSIKDKEIRSIIKRIRRYHLEIHLIITTTDIPVFSICAIIIDKTGLGPAVSVGIRAGFNKKDVIIGAIEESLMTRAWIRDRLSEFSDKITSSQHIKTIEDRAHYWFPKNMISKLGFWLKSDNSINLEAELLKEDNYKNNLQRLLKIFNEKEIDCYYVDTTSKIFKNYHVYVVKAVAPNLLPMYLDENYPNLGNTRLYKFANQNNLKTQKLNQIPHPFL